MRDPYDDRPYTAHAYAETHPGRLAAAARLERWDAPDVTNARILELGCGRGGNLLPMAASLPGAAFVGVDRSERQIDEARLVAARAGLGNVSFVHASFDAMELGDASFDYVVCHGVLSWIPSATRVPLLTRIAGALRDRGVACVSFNVLPGWYDRLAARDWLRFGASSLGVTAEGASESLAWLGERVSPELADYRRRLAAVGRRLDAAGPAYTFHEYLADEHHPLPVGALVREAAAAGLRFVGDAIASSTALELLPEDVRGRARSLDRGDAEQLADFVRGTSFRRALFVREDAAGVSPRRASSGLDPQALRTLFIASRLQSRTPAAGAKQESFAEGEWVVMVNDPAARRALHELANVAPRALSFDELARRSLAPGTREIDGEGRRFPAPRVHESPESAGPDEPSADACDALARELFDVWLATHAIDLRVDQAPFEAIAGDRPCACPVARVQALDGGVITNRLHQEVLVPDAVVRWVLGRLDGTRTRDELAHDARALDVAKATSDAERKELVEACIERLTACALIVRG